MKRIVAGLTTLLITLSISAPLAQTAPDFDLLITGGMLLDGTGNPMFRADVGIRDGRIVSVGRLATRSAGQRIDATGKVVSPGFIDLHSHADDAFAPERRLRSSDTQRRAAPNLVSQGVTTLVVNQDGRSPWPISAQRANLEEKGVGPNTILMIGHGSVRGLVLKNDYRRPSTQDEIDQMRKLVLQGMEEGAWGISAGLEYVPGRWSKTDEVIAIVEEIVPFGGIYISHERSEGADPMWYWPSQDPKGPPTLIDAIQETILIGEKTRATVVATHIKAKGAHYWGSGSAAIQLIDAARKRGVPIWADQYPYDTTGSDGNTVLIPRWVWDNQRESRDFRQDLQATLGNEEASRRLREDIAHEIRRRGGADRVVIFEHPRPEYVGKSLAEVAAAEQISPVELAIKLQLEGDPRRRGGARLRGFSLSEIDIHNYAAKPWVATASDAGIALPGDGPVHARFYGTFPRKIRKYAIEEGVLSVPDAVRSMTSLPAQILGIRDRGMVREGFHADIVIFDLDEIRDTSTFFEPHQYAEGIDYVLVNGEMVVKEGELTWALPGRVLTP